MRIIEILHITFITGACAFAPEASSVRRHSTSLFLSYNDKSNSNLFDMSKPVFDVFSLRSIRGDALLRYNTLNQSEPLRINLFALMAGALFSAPFISESVGGDATNTLQNIAFAVGGATSTGLFAQECQKRSNQLKRIEKELDAEICEYGSPLMYCPTDPMKSQQHCKRYDCHRILRVSWLFLVLCCNSIMLWRPYVSLVDDYNRARLMSSFFQVIARLWQTWITPKRAG